MTGGVLYPIYCTGCGVNGVGAVELPIGVNPAAATWGILCDPCGAAYRAQLAAGKITPGQVPPNLDKRPKKKP